MKKWAYLTLTVRRSTLSENLVYFINDQEARTALKTGPLGKKTEYPLLSQYLTVAGREGWEVVGMSPLETGGNATGPSLVLVILKREID